MYCLYLYEENPAFDAGMVVGECEFFSVNYLLWKKKGRCV